MIVDGSGHEDKSTQLITAWADSIIESAKQLMLNDETYLIAISGLPWYRQAGDAWVDELWWINTAKSRYERIKDLSNRMPIDELTILAHHFPSEYRNEARRRIDSWYQESAHDPEYWWQLAMMVYPEHAMFRYFLYEDAENYSEMAIMATLGYQDFISELRETLLLEYEHQDWFMVSDILGRIFSIGGLSSIKLVVSDNEIEQIRSSFVTLANKDLPDDYSPSDLDVSKQIFGQIDCIRIAVCMGWQDVIDALSKNTSYFGKLGLCWDAGVYDDILWWSLTDKKQFVRNLIFEVSPHTDCPNRLLPFSQFEEGTLALAISWKRATTIQR